MSAEKMDGSRLVLNASNVTGLGASLVADEIYSSLWESEGVDLVVAALPDRIAAKYSEESSIKNVSGKMRKLVYEAGITLRGIAAINDGTVLSLGDTGPIWSKGQHYLLVQQPYLAYGSEERDFQMGALFKARIRALEIYFGLGISDCTGIFVQTSVMKERLSQRWDIDPGRVYVVGGATSHMIRRTPEREETVPRPFVFYPAAYYPHKNHNILVDMLVELRRMGRTEVSVCITVDEEEASDIQARAAQHDVEDQIHFVGRVSLDRVHSLYMSALALVMPSKLESYGLPYYEAMSVGCPVVAAHRDFSQCACGPAALYANADRPREWAKAITKIATNGELRQEMIRKGKQRMNEPGLSQIWADWKTVSGRILKVVRE